MSDYKDQVRIRPESVAGENDWLWIKDETGAWDGPLMDWECSHRDKYFKYLKKRGTVITAGANQGLYARLYSKLFEHVYAFEPDPLNFHCLVYNTQRDNVVKMNCALSDKHEMIQVVRTSMVNTGQHNIASGGWVPCLTIDTFNFQECDLIQLDVEGHEFHAIMGAQETLKKFKPVVALENGHHKPIVDLMDTLGFDKVDQSVADSIFIPRA
jgi:FkbM family methyltransferase